MTVRYKGRSRTRQITTSSAGGKAIIKVKNSAGQTIVYRVRQASLDVPEPAANV